MFPMETCFVARDNSGVLTVKLGRETSLVAYSTDKRSIVVSKRARLFLASIQLLQIERGGGVVLNRAFTVRVFLVS